MSYSKIVSLSGAEAESLLKHKCNTIPKESVNNYPTPNYVDDSFIHIHRNPQVIYFGAEDSKGKSEKSFAMNPIRGKAAILYCCTSNHAVKNEGAGLLHTGKEVYFSKEIYLA